MSARVPDDMVSANERQQARIAELEAEVERVTVDRDRAHLTIGRLNARIDREVAEVERLSRRPDLTPAYAGWAARQIEGIRPTGTQRRVLAALRAAAGQEGR